FLRVFAQSEFADSRKDPFRRLASPAKGPVIVPFLLFAPLGRLREGFLLRVGFDEDDVLPDGAPSGCAVFPPHVHDEISSVPETHGVFPRFRLFRQPRNFWARLIFRSRPLSFAAFAFLSIAFRMSQTCFPVRTDRGGLKPLWLFHRSSTVLSMSRVPPNLT